MSFRQRQNLSGMLTGLLVAQYVFKNPLTHDLDHGLVIPNRLRSSVAEREAMAVPWTVVMELPSTH
ncbi:dynamin family protein [Aspergillus luchuensis]|uniref:Dynamin family protein n=1 Tax=Aspergillus kawachii TaxID=1069201 RepID=A0A146FI37_ASPKA|nr:dynamin family protein [Aspergillus luchuensis]